MLLCLDFGGSAIKYGLLDRQNPTQITDVGSVPNHFADQEEFLSVTFSLIASAAGRFPLEGIAVSYCGELDHEQGIIRNPGTYFYNAGLELRRVLEERTGLPVSIENDGNAAILAERKYGSLQNTENSAMLVLGTGIAGAFILDGKLYTGRSGMAGMLSFCTNDLEKPFGPENMAMQSVAVRFLIRDFLKRKGAPLPEDPECALAEYDGRAFNGKEFFRILAEGDEDAREALEAYAGNIARFIMTLNCILDVEAVAIGGGISAQDALIESITRQASLLFGPQGFRYGPSITRASFGSDANLIGAAIWFMEQHA